MITKVIVKLEECYNTEHDMIFPEGSTILDPSKILEEEDIFIDFGEDFQVFRPKFRHLFQPQPVCIEMMEYSEESLVDFRKMSFEFGEQEGVNIDWTSKLEGHLEFGTLSITQSNQSKRSKQEVDDQFESISKSGELF